MLSSYKLIYGHCSLNIFGFIHFFIYFVRYKRYGLEINSEHFIVNAYFLQQSAKIRDKLPSLAVTAFLYQGFKDQLNIENLYKVTKKSLK